ncbi:hypothetical protein VQ643_15965 [Pseudomonas sp. F1_0610]|uniref:hypothetical protein n=1 Tax=Pseudomonas sp. F1_0610 TaxID=3114284 RepID=UPI0039C1CC15
MSEQYTEVKEVIEIKPLDRDDYKNFYLRLEISKAFQTEFFFGRVYKQDEYNILDDNILLYVEDDYFYKYEEELFNTSHEVFMDFIKKIKRIFGSSMCMKIYNLVQVNYIENVSDCGLDKYRLDIFYDKEYLNYFGKLFVIKYVCLNTSFDDKPVEADVSLYVGDCSFRGDNIEDVLEYFKNRIKSF